MLGWIMPAPLVMPAIFAPLTSAKAVFRTVSVVMIAPAAASNCAASRHETSLGSAFTMSLASISTPITPVDAGRICSGLDSSRFAAARTHSSATRCPVRVAQFALPALTRIARTFPPVTRRFLRASSTGAATTRFCVNTAAATASGSDTISATSSLTTVRIPANAVA